MLVIRQADGIQSSVAECILKVFLPPSGQSLNAALTGIFSHYVSDYLYSILVLRFHFCVVPRVGIFTI